MKHIMKHTKRFVAFLLAAVMVLALGSVTAFAEEAAFTGTKSLTIFNDTADKTYDLYQVFYGDYATTSTSSGGTESSLANLQWGVSMDATNQAALLAKIKKIGDGSTTINNGLTIPDELKTAFPTNTWADKTSLDVNDVASALKTLSSNSEALNAFAAILMDVFEANSSTTKMTQSTQSTTSEQRKCYIFSNIHDGYYLVDDATDPLPTGTTRSRTMIEVVGPATMNAKDTSGPVIDKDTTSGANYAAAEIGKSVPFTLKSTVPDMGGYNKYYFIVTDKMGKGLTFDASSVEVKIDTDASTTDGTVTLTNSSSAGSGITTTYTLDSHMVTADDLTENGGTTGTYKYASLTTDDIGKTIITIVFKDMKQYQDKYQGEDIVITYNATVNKDFEAGNINVVNNKAYVTYPNDPNINYNGENEPTDDEKKNGTITTGSEETSDNTVRLYTTDIVVNKTDSLGNRLTGASFQISGQGSAATQTTTRTFVREFNYETDTTNKPTDGWYFHTASGMYIQMSDPATGGAEEVTFVYELTGATAVGETGWTMNQVAENTVSDSLYYVKSTATSALDTTDVILVTEYNALSSTDKKAWGTPKSGYAAYYMGANTTTVSTTGTSTSTKTSDNGQIIFENVGVTTYTITETDSPDGYELLSGNITVAITFAAPTSATGKATWTYAVTMPKSDGSTITGSITSNATSSGTGDAGSYLSIGSNGELIIRVVNESGAALPTTGGIGTTIFYIVGAILVLGAVVVLVTRKRMRGEQ